jgi:hypothetical protein
VKAVISRRTHNGFAVSEAVTKIADDDAAEVTRSVDAQHHSAALVAHGCMNDGDTAMFCESAHNSLAKKNV